MRSAEAARREPRSSGFGGELSYVLLRYQLSLATTSWGNWNLGSLELGNLEAHLQLNKNRQMEVALRTVKGKVELAEELG